MMHVEDVDLRRDESRLCRLVRNVCVLGELLGIT